MNHACRAASVAYIAFALMMVTAPVRAATPITKCGTVIKAPGSYIVTKNLAVSEGSTSDCITVHSNYVTIDLGGFTINCFAQRASGISDGFNPSSGIILRNGTITGCVTAVDLHSSTGSLVDGLSAISNGTPAVFLSGGSSVIRSVINDNSSEGILVRCPSSAIDNTALGNAFNVVLNNAGSSCDLFNNLAP